MCGASSAIKPAESPVDATGEDDDDKATGPLNSKHFCGFERYIFDKLLVVEFLFVDLEFPKNSDIFPAALMFSGRYSG